MSSGLWDGLDLKLCEGGHITAYPEQPDNSGIIAA